MSTVVLIAATVAVVGACALLGAAYYAEAHRAPDQS